MSEDNQSGRGTYKGKQYEHLKDAFRALTPYMLDPGHCWNHIRSVNLRDVKDERGNRPLALLSAERFDECRNQYQSALVAKLITARRAAEDDVRNCVTGLDIIRFTISAYTSLEPFQKQRLEEVVKGRRPL